MKMKANGTIATSPLVIDGQTVGLVFDVKNAGRIEFDMRTVHPAMIEQAARHGFKQRISDGAAMARDQKTGLPATEAEKFDAMQRLADHYQSGAEQWGLVATQGARGGFLFEALRELYPEHTPEQVREYLDGLSRKEQDALREDESVEPIIARMKRERMADQPKVDTKALLAKLG